MRLSIPSARHITKRMRTRKRPKRASSFLTIYLTKSRKTPCKHRLEFSCPCQSCPGIEEIQGDVSKDGVFQSLRCRHGCSGSVEITGSSPVCSTNRNQIRTVLYLRKRRVRMYLPKRRYMKKSGRKCPAFSFLLNELSTEPISSFS